MNGSSLRPIFLLSKKDVPKHFVNCFKKDKHGSLFRDGVIHFSFDEEDICTNLDGLILWGQML